MDVRVLKSNTSPPLHSARFNPFDFFYILQVIVQVSHVSIIELLL